MMGLDQASGLRGDPSVQGAQPTAPCLASMVAISSGKGGVGKTFLTVNLALALRKYQKRVLIVDADLGLANADIALGVNPDLTLQDVVFNGRPLADVVCTGTNGVDLVAASSGSREMVTLGDARLITLVEGVRVLAAKYDLVLLDCASGIAPMVLRFVTAAERNLIVATPDPASIMDVYALTKVIHQRQLARKLEVVINLAGSPGEGRRAFQILQKATRRFLSADMRFAGVVPRTSAAGRTLRDRQQLMLRDPGDAAAVAIMNLAQYLVTRQAGAPTE